MNINIFSGDGACETLNTPVRIGNKLENEFEDPITGATGKSIGMFKFFKDGKVIDKEKLISNLSGVKDNMSIMATVSFGKPSVFKRFEKPYEWPYWGYYGGNTDAISFVPRQNVLVCGFAIYVTDKPKFEVKYKIYIDDAVVEDQDKFVVSQDMYEDKFYYRIKLNGIHEVKAGSTLELACNFSENFDNGDYIS